MNYRILIFFCCVFISCNKNGISKKYYSNGNLKEKRYSTKNKTQFDSMIVYFEKFRNIPKSSIFLKNDSTYYQRNYFNNGNIKSDGHFVKNENFKIGKWKFYSINGYKESVMEYLNIRDKSYLNQTWVFDKKGDTLFGNKGHFYETNVSDTLLLGKANRIHFFLKEPFFSSESDVFVLLPKDEETLKDYFQNENTIEWDSIENIASRYKKVEYEDYNLNVVFDIQPIGVGEKKLRGIIMEKGQLPDDKSKYAIRKIYFDIPYYVIGNDGNGTE